MPINVDNNTKKETDGVWTTFQGSKFKVAASSSTKFQRIINRLQAPYRKKIEKGTLDPKISREIMCQAMSEALLSDWSSVINAGQPVDFSSEVAYTALMNNSDLREYLLEFSQDIENFKTEETEVAGKT